MVKLLSRPGEVEPRRAQVRAWAADLFLGSSSPERHHGLTCRHGPGSAVRTALGLAALIFAGCWALPGTVHAATFTASLDRSTVTLGESATLSLAFGGGAPASVPLPENIPNLQIVSAGSSQNFTIINGQTSSTVSYNFTLTPRQPGDYVIPALTADVAGQRLSSSPLALKVLKPTAPPPETINSGSQLAFLKLVLPKKQVHVGETFAARLELYLSSQVQRVSASQLSAFPADGFSAGKPVQGQQRSVQVGNAVYTLLPLDLSLKALRSGQLTVGPATFSLVLELPSANRPRDPFESFFGFGSRGEQRQVALATDAETIQSLPLPRENVPASFNGAVGTYTMSFSAGPTNVAAGDPITVRIQISGRGSPDALMLPEQPAWNDFKVLPPTTKVELADPLGIQGAKTFEQIVTPQNAEIKALPPFSFAFFDPDQKTYRTLTQPAVPLLVRPGGSTPAPTVLAANRPNQDSPPPAQGILPNKQRLGSLAQIGPPLAQQPWFLVLQGVPVLAFLSALVWRRRTESLAHNPRLRRQRKVAQVIRRGLNDLRRLANENQSEPFFATLSRLLQEQIGERLDLPASAITEAVLEEHLRPRGVPGPTLALLQDLFQTCNLARYAPIKTSQQLTALIPRLETALRDLQGLTL
jgi:hypothetical protein